MRATKVETTTLEDYGLTATMKTDYLAAIVAYEQSIPNTWEVVIERAGAGATLVAALKKNSRGV